MALAALTDGDYAAAIAAYDNIDELGPDMQNNYTKANFLRGRQLFESGSYRDAKPYFRATAYYLPQDRQAQPVRALLARGVLLPQRQLRRGSLDLHRTPQRFGALQQARGQAASVQHRLLLVQAPGLRDRRPLVRHLHRIGRPSPPGGRDEPPRRLRLRPPRLQGRG